MGIEAGNQNVRQEVSKGSFKDVNIREIVKASCASGMNVISNFNFGFPDDTHETMLQTGIGTRALHRNGNIYPFQALPGSPLYYEARAKVWLPPETYAGYWFLSYESRPLPTKHFRAPDVLLKLRSKKRLLGLSGNGTPLMLSSPRFCQSLCWKQIKH